PARVGLQSEASDRHPRRPTADAGDAGLTASSPACPLPRSPHTPVNANAATANLTPADNQVLTRPPPKADSRSVRYLGARRAVSWALHFRKGDAVKREFVVERRG